MRQLLALLLLSAPILANGTIEVRGDRADAVALTRHSVSAAICDQLAEVTVEQTFLSRGTRRCEGVYVFTLPIGASVAAFEMTVDGKTMRGEVVERDKARRIYEDIVSRKQDPALLEKLDDETFRARVFPIEPAKPVAIRLTYHQLLDDHDGALEFRYPLAKGRLGETDVAAVDVRIAVESSIDLVGVSCPSHAPRVEAGKRHATLSLSGGADVQAKDLLVNVRRDPKAIGFTLLGDAESRTFLAILSPPTRLADEAIPPRDLVYVVDTSGSMAGDKIAQAKAALKRGVSLLRARDRFRIVAFSTEVRPFRDGWTDATDDAKAAAAAWIDRLEANGGTAIDDALRAALAAGDPARLGLVVFLTDGLPTVGQQDGKRIVANAKGRNAAAMRVFCFGVGFDQDVPFLDELATSTRASREYVTEGQDLEAALVRFFDRVQQPALSDLSMEWGPGAREVYPNPLPDLFAGDRLVIAGRYDEPGARAVKLKGTRLGQPVEFTYEGTLPERGGVSAVARLWAQRKIDFLLGEIRRNGMNKELKDEIVSLATRHHIVTPYTAGLVVEDTPVEPLETVRGGGTDTESIDLETVHDHIEVDADAVFEEVIPDEGISDAPFTGPSTNASIGLGGGSGGVSGRGGMRRAGGAATILADTETAVEGSLRWLAAQQNADTGAIGNVEDTSLALLALFAADYTDRVSAHENRHAKCVRTALRFLISSQDADGAFGDRAAKGWLRTHAIATLAMADAYWMTRNPRYKRPAQEGLNLLFRLRNPFGGWGDAGDDTLTTVWALAAMKSGKWAGLEVDPDGFEGGRRVLDRLPESAPPTERAAALLARILLGEDPRGSAPMAKLADAVLVLKPVWREKEPTPVDLWYFGSLAMFQFGGAHWKEWNESMAAALPPRQAAKDAGARAGSWPVTADASPIGSQAKLAMCLEVYYRYDRVFGVK
jgi:Ca-activated chloride channel family protein